jgi:5'-3' exonuclease
MAPRYSQLDETERIRNEIGDELLFVATENTLYDDLGEAFYAKKQGVEVDPIFNHANAVNASKSKDITKIDWRCIERRKLRSSCIVLFSSKVHRFPNHQRR